MPLPNSNLTKLCGSCGYRLEATLARCPVDGARLARERAENAVLGSYLLVERLGTGGMGVVYRAIHEKLGRTVAIKVLNRAMLSDRTNVTRFFQEARSVNTIRHPNVVDVYDFVTAGKDIYMVMELLVGRDLHQALYDERGRAFSVERAVPILEQMCGALQTAHDRSIIHRDLKPANVYLTRRAQQEDFVKLLDFGLAKLERAEGKMTRDGVVLGTPEYMAPEQARGEALDNRSDLYAVGCIAYHMLGGGQLFAGGSYADVMVRHVKEAPPPLRRLNPTLPEPVEAVVMRCLAKDPGERPPTAFALAHDLATAAGVTFDATGAFAMARPRALNIPQSRLTPTPIRLMPELISRALSTPGRTRRRAIAGIAVAGVAGISGLFAVMRRRPTPASSAVRAEPSTGPGLQAVARIKLQTTPAGAHVFDEQGRMVGTTPHDLVVPQYSYHTFEFVLPGYHRLRHGLRADDLATTVALPMTRLPGHEAATEGQAPARREGPRRRAGVRRGAVPSREGGAGNLDSRAQTINPFDR